MSSKAMTVTEEPRSFEIGESFDLGIFEQKGVAFATALITEVSSDDTVRVVVMPNTKVFRHAQINTPLYVRRTHPTGVYMIKTVVIDRSSSHLIGLLLKHDNNWAHVQRRDSERLLILKDEAIVVKALAIDEYHRKHFKATLLDLGPQGLCVSTDEPVEWGERLHVELALKEPFGRVTVELRVLHKSRRNRPNSEAEDTSLRLGGAFVSLNKKTRLLINDFVMQEMADRYASGTQIGTVDSEDNVPPIFDEPVPDEIPPDKPAS